MIYRSLARERHAVPASLERRGRWRAGRRDVQVACASLVAIAAAAGSAVSQPLLDGEFLRSLEDSGLSPQTSGGRAGLINTLFGDVLPAACVSPRPKAIFREVFWRGATHELISQSDLAFVDDFVDKEIVDREGLRQEWARSQPNSRTALLVQMAWLATE